MTYFAVLLFLRSVLIVNRNNEQMLLMYFRFARSRYIFRCNQFLYGTGPFWKYSRSLSKELDLLLILTTYGRRKKREPKSYDMKLVLIDFICEVNDTGKTESYDGSVLLEALFRVRENESDSSIRTRILAIVKSRFPSFNETVLYASRQGRVVLNLSPCQTLDGKAVYTLKSKSTNNLYVMLSAPAPDRPPPDGDNEEEREHESEVRFFFPL